MRMRFILLSFLLFISCDRRELTYYEVVGVTLMADWSQAGLEGEVHPLHNQYISYV